MTREDLAALAADPGDLDQLYEDAIAHADDLRRWDDGDWWGFE